ATKVLFSNGRVERIGKDLTEFNGLDAGAFICSQEVFPLIERCVHEGSGAWNDVKREWIESLAREMRAFDLKGAFWLEVDTEEDLKRARKLLLQRLTKARDGIISRHLNRKLSCPLTSLLVSTKLTPNQISLLSFVVGLISGALFAFGSYPLVAIGGLTAQIASVIDGCDGEVARLKHATSKSGAWFDAVLDRVADAVIMTGMTYGSFSATGQPLVWILGTVALTASLLISYSEARYESAFGRKMPSSGRAVPAKRDARLFLVMLGGLLNQVLLTLIVLGFLGTSEVARRLWTSYRATRRPSRKGDSVLQRHKGKSVARVPAPQVLSSENAGAPNREFKDGMIGN
ncbi:MAG: CDP-alcohol phosphatidyltransferase family protein, partial [Anaerolineae bacterium]